MRIEDAAETDSGEYECQVTTANATVLIVNLNVLGMMTSPLHRVVSMVANVRNTPYFKKNPLTTCHSIRVMKGVPQKMSNPICCFTFWTFSYAPLRVERINGTMVLCTGIQGDLSDEFCRHQSRHCSYSN